MLTRSIIGQGRPLRALLRRLFWAVAVLLCAGGADAADLDVRIRIAWGGGDSRSWRGTISISQGQILDPIPLGLEADSPGSMQLVDSAQLRVHPRTPRTYDGLDLRVQAPADARLIISLTAPDAEPLDPIELSLAKVAAGFQQFDLDDRNNRLLAQRSPGDALRIKLSQDSLVYRPGESVRFEVTPNAVSLAAGTTYTLTAALFPGRSDKEITSAEYEVVLDEAGQPAAIAVEVPLPLLEGVYDIKLSLAPKRLASALVRAKPLAERQVQVVAVADVEPVQRTSAEFAVTAEVDPANPRWWERMARLPTLRGIPALGSQPIGSGKTKVRTRLDRPWVELPAAGWQAYPLEIASPGQPHFLDIEYPSDYEQTLGISLVEPNAAGQVGPIGVDSGVEVPPPAAGSQPEVRRHRLVVWPQTRSPYLLVINRRDNSPALFGKIVVRSGPAKLPKLEVAGPPAAGRMLAACYNKPLVPENFSATEALDPTSNRSFDDWQTFYEAGTRLVQTLQYAGYNAVVLSVACEGSSIYPSRLLEPNPKYDTGVFFESGQDPIRKDVLELMLRLCDRAGIQVVPAVQFSSPLPQLEKQRLAGGPDAAGLEPLGPDGQSWMARQGVRRGMGAYYNPLDDRVQAAMRAVVQELAERYSHHAAFAGVAVQWSGESYALLPDEAASCDSVTVTRFAQDLGFMTPAARLAPGQASCDFVQEAGPGAWRQWRCERMTELYRQMHGDIVAHRKNARLFLVPGELLAARPLQQALRPTLPENEEPQDVLKSFGIDPPLLLSHPGIVLPRPERHVVQWLPGERQLAEHSNDSAALDAAFAPARGTAAAVHFQEPAPLRVPGFDAASPFGPDKTHLWLVAQISPSGPAYRQRLVRSIAALDPLELLEGGWLLPLGQEESLAPLASVYRRLPAAPFTTIRPKEPAKTSGLTVRALAASGKTYFYAVNDSPWPADVEIDFEAGAPARVTSYAPNRQSTLSDRQTGSTWSVSLEPFDLVGGEVAGKVRVADYRVAYPDAAAHALREQVRAIRLRANALRSPPAGQFLANPSFEQPPGALPVPGWIFGSLPPESAGARVEVDASQGHESSQSLHVVSRAAGPGKAPPVVWIRSDSLEPPKTGRLSVVAWIRVADASVQPQLRLAIEGKLDGKTYYRRANVGASEDGRPVKPLTTDWASYRFPVTDLPLSGLSDLRVGFDLMGAGEVWIDEVRCFDLWFEETERDALLKRIATADVQLADGQLADCQRFVDGYWPSFLRQNVPLPEVPEGTTAAKAPLEAASPAEEKAATAEKPSMLDRLRSWWPKSSTKMR